VLLVDDHPVLRQGLRVLLERERFRVVGEAADGLEAIDMAEKVQPDIVVLDLAMPTLNGVSAVRGILKAAPGAKVILLTMHTEEYQILEAFRAGVKGCVSKGQAAEHLIQAIREVCNGRVYVSRPCWRRQNTSPRRISGTTRSRIASGRSSSSSRNPRRPRKWRSSWACR
jgi:DNA-binding NarL/FixJ family response regulator